MRKFLAVVAIFLFVASHALAEEKDLYYAADKTFSEPRNVELNVSGGMDFSNPYLNIRSLQVGTYWLASPYFAFGLEGSKYDSSLRSSAQVLTSQLASRGFQLSALAPLTSANAAVRFTPISGLVNFLGWKIIKTDISLVARVGGTEYQESGWVPLVGAGIDLHFSLTNRFGIHTSFNWNAEKVADWQWRNGFLVGPSLRF